MREGPMHPRELRRARVERRERLAAERERLGRNVWWRRFLRWQRRKVGGCLLDRLGPMTLRMLARSWRIERVGVEHYEAVGRGTGFISVLWHGRMLPLAPLHRGLGYGVLVSPSADGALVLKVLDRFGYRVIRGSASQQGSRALRDMRGRLQDGGSVVITPDGPVGPRHSMNVGVAWLAREAGVPILTVAVASDRAWHANSWDRFLIPKVGARVVLTYGELIEVARDADDAELERVVVRVREQLIRDETRGFERLGVAPDW